MSKILSIKRNDEDFQATIDRVAAQYALFPKAGVREVFQAVEEERFEEAASLCCELLDDKVVPEIQMLLGQCYFMEGHMQNAAKVFSDLRQAYPQEEEYRMYLGITYHALGDYSEAVKELEGLYPLKEYHPFYYTSYGDSLRQTGSLKRSREVFYEEVAHFENTHTIASPAVLDGTFQNLLYLDVTLGNGQYEEDVKRYYDFLDQVEMTEDMQNDLAGNILYFSSTLMRNKWYRPLFLEFITHIRDRNFLTAEYGRDVLSSAFRAWESYGYHEDRRISALMEEFLSSHHGLGDIYDGMAAEERQFIEVKALSYEWYMCQYAEAHKEEIDCVKENYPCSYENTKAVFEKIEHNAEETAAELLNQLYAYAKGESRAEFEAHMRNAYMQAGRELKEPVYLYDGKETYRRIQPKVGRNDPCPCGSGKKYKKCCGR